MGAPHSLGMLSLSSFGKIKMMFLICYKKINQKQNTDYQFVIFLFFNDKKKIKNK